MKIFVADTFFDSLRKIRNSNRWYVGVYDFFRWDIPNFCKNVWFFKKELWNFKCWDSGYSLEMLKRSLELLCNNIEKYGHEVDESRLKKIAKMKRAIELLHNHIEDNFIEQAEKELKKEVRCGFDFIVTPESRFAKMVDTITHEEEIINRKIFDRTREIENSQWKELFVILQGQDELSPMPGLSWEEASKRHEEYYDGSGMKGWWD